MENKWCHENCYNKALYKEIDPKFSGACNESCQDESCKLEHSDYDIDYMP